MGNLDTVDMKWNTPERRAQIINLPAWQADKTLDTFPRQVPPALFRWIAAVGDELVPPGLVLYGAVGRGKTGLGGAALKQLARQGFGDRFHWNLTTGDNVPESFKTGRLNEADLIAPCWFMSWTGFMRMSLARRQEQEWWENFDEKVSALMLDDVVDTTLSPLEERTLRSQIEWLYEPRGYVRQRRALILTSNEHPRLWNEALGKRIADRLTDPDRFLMIEV